MGNKPSADQVKSASIKEYENGACMLTVFYDGYNLTRMCSSREQAEMLRYAYLNMP